MASKDSPYEGTRDNATGASLLSWRAYQLVKQASTSDPPTYRSPRSRWDGQDHIHSSRRH